MIHYDLHIHSAAGHLFEVVLAVAEPAPDGQVVSLPTWIPGSYMIREFSKNIVTITAEDDAGSVKLTMLDKQTWKAAPCTGVLRITTVIYAWDLSVRCAHLDQSHGYFNGTSVFLNAHGHAHKPHQVCIHPPTDPLCADWRVATTLQAIDENGQRRIGEDAHLEFGYFAATDYDDLIDHPVEMGTFNLLRFVARGIPHEIALTGVYSCDEQRLIEDLQLICETEIDFFGELPAMERYLFQIMIVGAGYGGLEHRSSTSLLVTRDSLPSTQMTKATEKYIRFLGLCSHEYFHTWNVKQIKPASFFPYDLSKENHTSLLWVFEGWTSYYDDLLLLRCGLINLEQYLKLLGKTITRVRKGHAADRQSLNDSSWTTWTKFYRQDENAVNSVVSYYAKGALAALALDMHLRQHSNITLDTVMKALWQRYGARGIGVPETGVEELTMELSGLDLSAWFQEVIRQTDRLPLESAMEQLGILLQSRPAQSSSDLGGSSAASSSFTKGSLGATFDRAAGGVKVKTIINGSAAEKMGLSAKDLIVAVNHLQVNKGNIDKMLGALGEGTHVTIHAFRRDELKVFTGALDAPQKVFYLTANKEASEKQLAERQLWLAEDSSKEHQ